MPAISVLNRRDVIGVFTAFTGTGILTVAVRQSRLVKAENEKPGSADCQLTYVKLDPKAKYRQPLIEG
jgi:hypothetical protein